MTIIQEKFDLRREWGVSFDEIINDTLAFTIHCSRGPDEDEAENLLITWIAAKDDRRYDELYRVMPVLKPADPEELIVSDQYTLWSNWEAAY